MKEDNKPIVYWFLFAVWLFILILLSRFDSDNKNLGIYTLKFLDILIGIFWTAMVIAIAIMVTEKEEKDN